MTTPEESHLTGVGGLRIYWQSWLPDAAARAIVVIAHGAGEHSGRYPHVASRLVREGYAVYLIDHRGHGRSQGSRALIDRIDNTVADLDSLILLAGGEHPGAPVFLLGHSMGGTISLRYAMRYQADDAHTAEPSEAGSRAGGRRERLSGLVLSGPLAALEAGSSPPARFALKMLSVLTPKLPMIAVDASLVSRDPAVVAAYETDPLVHHGKLPARTVAELVYAVDSFPQGVRAITVPTLIMYGTADGICPPAGSVMLGERISSADKTVIPFEGLYHEILNEPEQVRVLDEICAWLTARVAAPAG